MVGMSLEEEIKSRLDVVQEQIEKACRRSQRSKDSITLIGVSKKQSLEKMFLVQQLGVTHFGENYVQELTEKKSEFQDSSVHWHFIGGLQRNKCKFLVGEVDLIHSVDRLPLAQEIHRLCEDSQKRQSILIQVNQGEEISKSGAHADNIKELAENIMGLPTLNLLGLMSIPPPAKNEKEAKFYFSELRSLAEAILIPMGISNPDLSMGMSHDFMWAIEEGATMIRVGTGIFGSRA